MSTKRALAKAKDLLESINPDSLEIQVDESLFVSGRLSSIQALQLVVAIEKCLGEKTSTQISSLSQIDTLRKIALIISSSNLFD